MRSEEPYRKGSVNPAFALRWTWTGWPSSKSFPDLNLDAFPQLLEYWEKDGIRPLEVNAKPDQWQITVSVKPHLAPCTIVQRIKGRLDHAFRNVGLPIDFSRKVGMRSVGNNVESEVRNYIAGQVNAAEFLDPKFAEDLAPFTRVWNDRRIETPIIVDSGRYWYQLHIVLVTDERYRYRNIQSIAAIHESIQSIAIKHDYLLGSLSVMPDHVHMQLRGDVKKSPLDIALDFQNGVAIELKTPAFWMPTFYVGTVGAYNMRAVRSDRES
jgi:REP element-mobilizing transposase RayT